MAKGMRKYRYLNFFLDECKICLCKMDEHKDIDGVIQILNDGRDGRSFISEYPDAQCVFFDEYSEQLVVSDGKKCTVYRLCI